MNFKGILRKSFRETKKKSFILVFFNVFLIYLMQRKNRHFLFFKLCYFLTKINIKIAYYYQAELYFFYADYKKALNSINIFLQKEKSFNVDALLLKIHLLYLSGFKTEAWDIIKQLQQKSHRLKIWMLMSKMVETQKELSEMENLYLTYKKTKINSNKKIEIQKYISKAAANINMYKVAENYLKEAIELFKINSKIKNKKKYFSKSDAKIALEDLSFVFSSLNLDFFLVSGTFLGCIRDKNFVSNDYDIDIGIWEKDYSDGLKQALEHYGVFHIHEPKWNGGIKLKHINGILIDIFIHYEDGNKHYHLGSVAKWYNSTFELVKYWFLNKQYFGFKDYDLYLSENYGDWKIKKKDFDNILDTPNAVIYNNEEYRLHLYRLSFKRDIKNLLNL